VETTRGRQRPGCQDGVCDSLPRSFCLWGLGLPVNLLSVVTAADDRYAHQACVLARSLALSQVAEVELTVLGTGWSASQIGLIRAAGGAAVKSRIVDPADGRVDSVRTLKHGFPAASIYSVIAPQNSLFDEADRIIYLDADTLVRGDLRDLLSVSMTHPVAAVADAHVALMGMPSMWRAWREENVDPTAPYLNTGVMVIDVRKWRDRELTDAVLRMLTRYELPCVDQDALNLVLAGDFDRLAPRWNLMPYHLMRLLRTCDLIETDESLENAITDPAIVHYHRSFLGKPWQVGCTHPARHLWRELARDVGHRRPSLSVRDVARNAGARVVGMSVLDPRCEALRQVRLRGSVM